MVIQNYPGGFVGNVRDNYGVTSEVSIEPKKEEVKEQRTRTERELLDSKIRKLTRDLKDITSGKAQASEGVRQNITNQLKKAIEQRNNLVKTGTAYSVETTTAPSEQASKDVVFTDKGQGVSKAYELQTEKEKQRTSEVYSKFQSTNEGIKYVGDTNDDKVSRVINTFEGSNYNGLYLPNVIRGGYNYRSDSYIGRAVSPQETTSISSPIRYDIPSAPNYSGTIEANKGLPFRSGLTGMQQAEFKYILEPSRKVTEATSSILGTGILIGGEIAYGVGERGLTYYKNPVELGKTIGTGIALTFLGPLGLIAGGGVLAYNVGSQNVVENSRMFGGLALDVGIFKTPETASRLLRYTAPYIPPEQIFSKRALDYGELPKASSTQNSLERFNKVEVNVKRTSTGEVEYRTSRDLIAEKYPEQSKFHVQSNPNSLEVVQKPFIETDVGYVRVVSASPNPIPGEKGIITSKIIPNTKASYGFEGPGINTAPYGEGSSEFLRIGKTTYEFSLNPLKSLYNKPTAQVIETYGAVKTPYDVVKVPGFGSEKAFYESQGYKTGKVYVDKRSMLGQNELPRQFFTLEQDAPAMWNKMTIRVNGVEKTIKRGEIIKAGTEIKEPGTKEIQAIVPYTAKAVELWNSAFARFRGSTARTEVKGEIVDIKTARLLREEDLTDLNYDPITNTINNPNVNKFYSNEVNLNPIKLLEFARRSDRLEVVNAKQLSSTSKGNTIVNLYGLGGVTANSLYDGSNVSQVSKVNARENSSIISIPNKSNVSNVNVSNISNVNTLSKTSVTNTTPSYPKPEPTSEVSLISVPRKVNTPEPSYPVPSYPRPEPKTPYPIPTTYPIEYFSRTLGDSKKKKSKSSLYVKRRGKFELKGENEDVGLLFKKGRDLIENTASASFKVVSESGKAILPNILGNKYYKSKKNEGVIVQKREFRIGTSGEKFDITRKGIEARRNKLI